MVLMFLCLFSETRIVTKLILSLSRKEFDITKLSSSVLNGPTVVTSQNQRGREGWCYLSMEARWCAKERTCSPGSR